MKNESILQLIRDKIQHATSREKKALEKEKNEVKRTKLSLQIQLITEKIIIGEIKSLSAKQFDKLIEEISQPLLHQRISTMKKIDSLVFKTADEPEEFEKYKKIKKLQDHHSKEIIRLLDEANLHKKALERYLALMLVTQVQNELTIANYILEYNEIGQATRIVNERFGFDDKWLIGMSLIQLHENMIKKKIVQLNGIIKEEDSLNILISRLADLIRKNEKRDVGLRLQMSSGLKKIRDIMTHEGYKHKVTKEDLTTIIEELKKLEKVLYTKSENLFT